MINANTEEDLKEIAAKIEKAREWARQHFNAKQAGDPRFVDHDLNFILAMFVEFPTPDTMRVTPSILGKPHGLWFEYKLHFKKDGSLEWHGNNPFWGTPTPHLRVE